MTKGLRASKIVQKTAKTPTRLRRALDAPASRASIQRTTKPRWSMNGERMVIHHREYVGAIETDSDNIFAYDAYPIDVSNAHSFPWLAGVAQNFEDFQMESFAVEVVPSCGTNTSGNLILSVDFDAHDPDDNETKQTLMQIEDAIQTPIWQGARYVAKPQNLRKFSRDRFVAQPSDSTADARFTSVGVVYVATTPTNLLNANVGVPPYPTASIGDVFFDYKVSFATPQASSLLTTSMTAGVAPRDTQLYRNSDTSTVTASSGVNLLRGVNDSPLSRSGIIDPAAFGARVITSLANQYIDPNTGSILSSNEKLIELSKDTSAHLLVTLAPSSGSPVWTTAPSSTPVIQQYVRAEESDNALNFVLRNDAPNLAQNTFSILQASANAAGQPAIATYLISFAAAAGTAIRLISTVGYVVNLVGGVLRTRAVIDSRKFSSSELDEMRKDPVNDPYRRPVYSSVGRSNRKRITQTSSSSSSSTSTAPPAGFTAI